MSSRHVGTRPAASDYGEIQVPPLWWGFNPATVKGSTVLKNYGQAARSPPPPISVQLPPLPQSKIEFLSDRKSDFFVKQFLSQKIGF